MIDKVRSISGRTGLFWLFALVVAATLGLPADAADAAIYRYVDRAGVSHYTDAISQVPPEYRNQVRDITPEMEEMTGFRVIKGLNDDSPARKQSEEAKLDVGNMDFGDFEGAEMLSGVLESLGFGVILLCLLAIPALYVVSALIFKLSCRIGGEEPPGLGRACAILFLQSIVGSAVGAAVNGVGMGLGIEESAGAAIAVGGGSSILSWMANAGILTSMMSYGFLRSMWIGFLHTLLVIVMIGGPIGAIALVALL